MKHHKKPTKTHPSVRFILFILAVAVTVWASELVKSKPTNVTLMGISGISTFLGRFFEVICDVICDRAFPHWGSGG